MAAAPTPSGGAYSFIDKAMHRIAFAHPRLQIAFSEIETDINAAQLKGRVSDAPTFVAGLPRAGTTLALEMLYATGEFSTFTYRHMPFLLAPILWSSISKPFQRQAVAVERAHGDGMDISFDSPEAFEEVIWLAFHRARYVKDRSLAPIRAVDIDETFADFFRTLIVKLTLPEGEAPAKRYLSKNNANLSRLDAIPRIFNDARIIVCFRDPLSHVGSLMTQHERFLSVHDTDRFAADYMRWIGHFDFGANFRPIDFAGRKGFGSPDGTPGVDFWLSYWLDAYAYALDHAPKGALFLCYEDLFNDPAATLRRLGDRAGVRNRAPLDAFQSRIRPPTSAPPPVNADPALVAAARDRYAALVDRARA